MKFPVKYILKALFYLFKTLALETLAVLKGEISFPHYLWLICLILSTFPYLFKPPKKEGGKEAKIIWIRKLGKG